MTLKKKKRQKYKSDNNDNKKTIMSALVLGPGFNTSCAASLQSVWLKYEKSKDSKNDIIKKKNGAGCYQ